MQFAPNVEQYRSYIASRLPAGVDIDKVLWVMSGESGGDPNAIGDNGVAIGLFQIQNDVRWPGRPTTAQLLNPYFNIDYALNSLGINNNNFSAWGEGTAGTPHQFGALGNHPYPGSGGSSGGNSGGSIPVGLPGIPGLPHIPGAGWVTDAAGNIIGAGGGVIGSIFDHIPGHDIISGLPSLISNAINVTGWLLDPRHWMRLGFLMAGAVMMLFGMYVYIRGDKVFTDAATVGKTAAKAGEAGAAA